MPIIKVPVVFQGNVSVKVPASVPQRRREFLAQQVALAMVVATTENPDAPVEDATDDYQSKFGLDDEVAEREFDKCSVSVGGVWTAEPTEPVLVGIWIVGHSKQGDMMKWGRDGDTEFPLSPDTPQNEVVATVRNLVKSPSHKGDDFHILHVFNNGQMKTYDFDKSLL